MTSHGKEVVSYRSAFVGTLLHTAASYLAPVARAPQVEVAEILGAKLANGQTKPVQSAAGLITHFALGTVVFPTVYNTIFRPTFPRKPLGPICWAMMLFITGQTVVMPLCGVRGRFRRQPKRVLVYWLAHVLYGLACASKDRSSSEKTGLQS